MSAKDIVKRNNYVLSNELKVSCLRTRYYKCAISNIKFKLINEYYTSKTCSLYCSYNENLAGNKLYNCDKYKYILDRNINQFRNIYMKPFIN
jgi:hypothetical protein